MYDGILQYVKFKTVLKYCTPITGRGTDSCCCWCSILEDKVTKKTNKQYFITIENVKSCSNQTKQIHHVTLLPSTAVTSMVMTFSYLTLCLYVSIWS